MLPFNRLLIAAAAIATAAVIDVAASQPAGKTALDGVYSDAQSTRGEDLSKASCVTCHGEGLAGTDLAPALVLGAQLIMGILFGVLGLFLADPLLVMIKIALERRAAVDCSGLGEDSRSAAAGSRRW